MHIEEYILVKIDNKIPRSVTEDHGRYLVRYVYLIFLFFFEAEHYNLSFI